jgi:hypothetical protein
MVQLNFSFTNNLKVSILDSLRYIIDTKSSFGCLIFFVLYSTIYIIESVNTEKICFRKLCLDDLENLRQNKKKMFESVN